MTADAASVRGRLGIEALSGLGLPPPAFVRLASDLGCPNVSLSFRPRQSRSGRNPSYCLATDPALRREVRAAMRDVGVTVSLGEGCVLTQETSARRLAEQMFDPMLDLDIRRINVVGMDLDLPRMLDELGALVEMALAAGFEEVVCEFAPILALRDLPEAVAALDHVNRREFKLLIDTMHFARTGGTPADLAALDPSRIGYIQLCDAPLASSQPYLDEAVTNRLAPGEGELPLLDMLAAMPHNLIVSLELPQLAKLEAGLALEDILRPAVETTRGYLARLPAFTERSL